jgi:hypothetical protein
MWHEDRGKATLVDPEGQVHRLRPILPKKWKIKYASSSPDRITVDFHTDATHSDRIPKHVFIVNDSNRKDFLMQENQKRTL